MDALKSLLNEARQFLTEIVNDALAQQAAKKPTPVQTEEDQFFTVQELSDYLPGHPPVATIYGYSSKGTIPKTKIGRRVVFSKRKIDDWVEAMAMPTNDEISAIPIPRKKRK